ncbi:MAG: hypothetical protein Q8P18_32025 [Pseudomonadota bacterium]|nr:hypothetical protein [Pseudomonadota bacterium]
MTRLLLLLLVLVLVLPAFAGEADRAALFARFDHARHTKPLQRAGVTCTACHQVGATGDASATSTQLRDTWLIPRNDTCHTCHAAGEGGLGAGEGMTGAPRACATCHTDVRPPESHAVGWLALHGGEAAVSAVTCRDCHTRTTCAECHDRSAGATSKVHDRSWLTVHGVAARAAPAGCDSCHIQNECTSCHAAGAGFGRSP